MSLKLLPLQRLTPKKSNTPNPKYSPVSPATTAMGTRWVMPQNLGTAHEVLFSNDPAHGDPAASRRLGRGTNTTSSLIQPRWFKHRYRLPETLIQVAHSDSAMLKIICSKLIAGDGIIHAFGDQKIGAGRHNSRCNCCLVRLVGDGATTICDAGRGRFPADRRFF